MSEKVEKRERLNATHVERNVMAPEWNQNMCHVDRGGERVRRKKEVSRLVEFGKVFSGTIPPVHPVILELSLQVSRRRAGGGGRHDG